MAAYTSICFTVRVSDSFFRRACPLFNRGDRLAWTEGIYQTGFGSKLLHFLDTSH